MLGAQASRLLCVATNLSVRSQLNYVLSSLGVFCYSFLDWPLRPGAEASWPSSR